ncbi:MULTISPECIES: SUMF1/EgtB/PvdO family nonheme iron enzyme [unclassified Caballeronia]|uniref:SUMF1/EgtB/PvdO family nonheme iron enzyme n=1 Tax=unclassified Caballeronia TaxID=2646786 RepID=UPI002857A341|nr:MULTISPECIES: SUMF1/EgtB/PvdO family nonheme iron enzyme [unclassified Caballeronia]MDR5818249.1 SUMF1/EgtB/PvdO family nonheme iron enzyme [Caballeronia sp. LZ033]MDR5825216.1 SUMF1/EgtB/PvdO family nonheme iron enzyme [Caballeronia sp. LZ043]MDR5883089.1 SUMF1/EgtB/PvdO family nonheme iron enzyme [Caballeronia sp. LZ032]
MNREPSLRHPLLERLAEARRVTDELFGVVKPEHLYDRPIAERHRIVFYIGHLEAFDRNLFDQRLFDLPSPNPAYDQLFAFGIDPVDGGLPTDQPADWPTLDEVRAYRDTVRAAIDACFDPVELAAAPLSPDESPAQLLEVAIEHRLMHAETLAYMLHQLPVDRKIAPSDALSDRSSDRPLAHESVRVPAGTVTLGLARDSGLFGWDNEFGEQRVDVPAFEIDRHMVTNGDWLRFIEAGGYSNRAVWDDADWAWKEEQRIAHPAFWIPSGAAWTLRTMFDEIALPLDWPVFVSHAEAKAYARWAGKKLPSEAQWQRAASGAPHVAEGNFDFRRWDPSPVQAHPDNRSEFGVEGQFGNGWEWTSTEFAPLDGFEPFPFYLGYSANFFDGKHFVIKGGSPRTAACMLRPSFRNWFQGHYQYVYAGFRCVNA